MTLGLGTDNRKLLFLRPSITLERGQDGSGNETSASVAMTIQPSTQLLLTLTPSYRRVSAGAQYVATSSAVPYPATYGARYLFADLERREVSMVARANWTFTPRFSLEFFAQPLVSSGDYVAYKQLVEPETFMFDVLDEGTASGIGCLGGRTCEDGSHLRRVDFDNDGTSDLDFADRDFNVRSLRSTAVVRWEYRPGSTFFFVWQHSQVDRSPLGDFAFGRDAGALFTAPSNDVFILKANVWLAW